MGSPVQSLTNVQSTAPVDLCLKQASLIPLIALPQSQSTVMTSVLPMTAAAAAATFALVLDLFSQNQNSSAGIVGPGVASFTSNSANSNANSQIQCTILVIAVCVGIEVEPQAYCIPAAAVSNAITGITVATDGAPGPGDTQIQNASYRHGIDTWLMKIFFARAYSMRVTLGCRFIILDEPLSVTGLCEREDWEGFGTAQTSLMDDLRRTNDRLASIGATFHVERINTARFGGGAGPLLPGTVPVQYGAPNISGSYGGLVRLQQPLLLMSRISFGIQLYVSSDPGAQYFHSRLLEAASSSLTPQFAAAQDGPNLVDIDPAVLIGAAGAGISVAAYNGGTALLQIGPGQAVPRDVILVESVGGVLTGTVLQPISAFAGGPIVIPVNSTFTAGAAPPGGAAGVTAFGALSVFGPINAAIGQGGEIVVKDGAFVVRFSLLGFELAPKQVIEFYSSYSGFWPADLAEYYVSEGGPAWDKLARLSGIAGLSGFEDLRAKVDAERENENAPRLGRLVAGFFPPLLPLRRRRGGGRSRSPPPCDGRTAGLRAALVRPFFFGEISMDLFDYAQQICAKNPRLATGILLGQYIPVTYQLQVTFTDAASKEALFATLRDQINCDLLVFDIAYSVVRPNYFTGSLFRGQEEVNNTLIPGITVEIELQACPRLLLTEAGTDIELAMRPSPLPLRMPRPFLMPSDSTLYVRLSLARTVAPAEIPMQVNMLVSGYQFVRGLWTTWSQDRYDEYLEARLGARYQRLARDP